MSIPFFLQSNPIYFFFFLILFLLIWLQNFLLSVLNSFGRFNSSFDSFHFLPIISGFQEVSALAGQSLFPVLIAFYFYQTQTEEKRKSYVKEFFFPTTSPINLIQSIWLVFIIFAIYVNMHIHTNIFSTNNFNNNFCECK